MFTLHAHVCLTLFDMLCRAEAVYQSMKSVYGPNACHLLQINSVHHIGTNPRPNLPDPWSQFIIPTSEDTLVRDYMWFCVV